MIYNCEKCGHIHDEEVSGKVEDLPEDAVCPDCGANAHESYKQTLL